MDSDEFLVVCEGLNRDNKTNAVPISAKGHIDGCSADFKGVSPYENTRIRRRAGSAWEVRALPILLGQSLQHHLVFRVSRRGSWFWQQRAKLRNRPDMI